MRKRMEMWVGLCCWDVVIVSGWWGAREECCPCPGRNSLYSDYNNNRKTSTQHVAEVSEVAAPSHAPTQTQIPKPSPSHNTEHGIEWQKCPCQLEWKKVNMWFCLVPSLPSFSPFLTTPSSMGNASCLHTPHVFPSRDHYSSTVFAVTF